MRRALRVAGWNAALILAGLALIAAAGEAWQRLTTPSFVSFSSPTQFVPGVGVLYESNAEIRFTNGLDFWTVSRANSLGFIDREPPDPERAAASCHVAVFGDSFVAAREVEIADKLQVRLEALAATALPGLDVTVSAYGHHGTSQIDHLGWYDEYARPRSPNLAVLVFTENDFRGSRELLRRMRLGWDPASATGALQEPRDGRRVWYESATRWLTDRSLFARWLDSKRRAFGVGVSGDEDGSLTTLTRHQLNLVTRGPGWGWVLDGWDPPPGLFDERLLRDGSQPDWRTLTDSEIHAWSREITAMALAGFKYRADRDSLALVILAEHGVGKSMSVSGLLQSKAALLGIPVIDQRDWIVRSGGRVEDAQFRHDIHWSAQGHQWAAEAILDWLRRHPEVCED